MFGWNKRFAQRRRTINRESRADSRSAWMRLRECGGAASLGIAGIFGLCLFGLFLLRQQVVAYRPGEYVPHDITARVDFNFVDKASFDRLVERARDEAPHVYRQTSDDIWGSLEALLLSLPDRAHGISQEQLDPPLRDVLDSGALTALEQDRSGPDRKRYEENVRQFVAFAQKNLTSPSGKSLVILAQDDWDRETARPTLENSRLINLEPATLDPDKQPTITLNSERTDVDVASEVYGTRLPDSVLARLQDYAKGFDLGLGSKIARLTEWHLSQHPNYQLDESATAQLQNFRADHVDPKQAVRQYLHDSVIVLKGTTINDRDWQVLRAENDAYQNSLRGDVIGSWQYRFGLFLSAFAMTIALCAYVARYQPRCVRNHSRAIAIAALLLSMLLISELAGISSYSLYFLGIVPIIVAAMILTIAYDQRFAVGVATIHAVMATAVLHENLEFFMVLWVGVITACYLLDDIRTRSKLIEVGGITSLAMIIVTAASGAIHLEPRQFIAVNCLYVGLAGLAAGFVVLGILPFIEKAFRITTSMTLLELADVSLPLLRRLALEAPGTYNHSLQVATLAEAAAEEIKANSLLCRVGSYYHDIGKISKPDYFVENQTGGENRHLNLSPTLSLRIILSHVKDGVEMAKQYGLPTSILPIIQQHHGTTLVEYFYNQAMTQTDNQPDSGPRLSDTEFRYPGPKPKSREAAIVMLCDAVESACRCIAEPTVSRIESLVHELALKRLHDGQFDECDLTMRDLERVERSLAKTLAAIYHGRIAYPSNSTLTAAAPTSAPTVKTA